MTQGVPATVTVTATVNYLVVPGTLQPPDFATGPDRQDTPAIVAIDGGYVGPARGSPDASAQSNAQTLIWTPVMAHA